jgi:hypothetical protein
MSLELDYGSPGNDSDGGPKEGSRVKETDTVTLSDRT